MVSVIPKRVVTAAGGDRAEATPEGWDRYNTNPLFVGILARNDGNTAPSCNTKGCWAPGQGYIGVEPAFELV